MHTICDTHGSDLKQTETSFSLISTDPLCVRVTAIYCGDYNGDRWQISFIPLHIHVEYVIIKQPLALQQSFCVSVYINNKMS